MELYKRSADSHGHDSRYRVYTKSKEFSETTRSES